MKRALDLLRILSALLLLGSLGYAEGEKVVTRELPPRSSIELEKIFLMEMDKVQVPVTKQEYEMMELVGWMMDCDRSREGGGRISFIIAYGDMTPEEVANFKKKKIRLTKKNYTFRTILDEICAQTNFYWWMEPYALLIGSKSDYEKVIKRASQPAKSGS